MTVTYDLEGTLVSLSMTHKYVKIFSPSLFFFKSVTLPKTHGHGF